MKDIADDTVSRVRDYILRHAIFAAGDAVVVAVSGGADSLCLLYALHDVSPTLGLRLHVAHLDHALRPGSTDDAAYVAAQARLLGLLYAVERVDVAGLARRERLSIETAARAARYEFLRAVAARTGAGVIVTGHTRDDQAETVLISLARGSGLNGLTGMAPRRADIARPLLEISHAEALAYCAARGLTPREDESNQSPLYRRNRMRHDVLPALDKIYPNAGANIARAARLLAGDLALVERLARHALDAATVDIDATRATLSGSVKSPGTAGCQPANQRGRESVMAQAMVATEAGWQPAVPGTADAALSPTVATLSAARWGEAEPELRPHMTRLLLRRLLGSAAGFDERAYHAIEEACAPGAPDTTFALSKGLTLTRRGDVVTLGRVDRVRAPAALCDTVLPVPGMVDTEVGRLRADRVMAPHDWTAIPANVAYLDPIAVGPALIVRAWRAGDRAHPLGMAGTRKAQDLFVDRKVPRAARRRVPIVEGARGIAWIGGLCTSEDYRVEQGAEAVRVTWDALEG